MDPAAHAQAIYDQGFTLFESAYDEAWVEAVRGEIMDHYATLGSPPVWARDAEQLGEGIVVCMAGLAVHGFLNIMPERARSLFKPEIVATLREVLGEDMHMETAGWVISDKHRPFFSWHIHAHGQDDSYHLGRGFWPTIETTERVMMLLYLDDLAPEHGPLLIHPRRVGTPLDPPQDTSAENWEGMVELNLKRGSVVVIDECTWHAVRQQLSEQERIWICAIFSAPHAPRGGWFDERLTRIETSDPVLRSLLPPAVG